MRTIIITVVAFMLFACASPSPPLRVAQKQESYHLRFDLPTVERIAPIPELLLEDLRTLDHATDYSDHALTDEERTTFEQVFSRLPSFLSSALGSEVGAIYFVNNFAGAGFTYDLWKDNNLKFVLILNPKTFQATVQDWLTYRDNTAFLPDQNWTLREVTSQPIPELVHVLLHESSHVYDMAHHVTNNQGQPGAFSRGIWAGFDQIEARHDFEGRSAWHFYDVVKAPKVPLSSVVKAFPRFRGEVFASLYATGNAMEDFAEVIAYGTIDQSWGTRVQLQLLQDGEVLAEFDPMDGLAGERFAAFVPE